MNDEELIKLADLISDMIVDKFEIRTPLNNIQSYSTWASSDFKYIEEPSFIEKELLEEELEMLNSRLNIYLETEQFEKIDSLKIRINNVLEKIRKFE